MTGPILEWAREMRARYNLMPRRVLEVGSCIVNGSLRSVFQDPGCEWIGIDQQAGPGVDVVGRWGQVAAEWKRQPGPRNLFDLAVCTETIEHCTSPEFCVRRMIDWLCAGGWLIVTTPGKDFPVHSFPRDYWRILPDAFEDVLLRGLTIADHVTTADPCECYLARKG